MKRLLRSGIVSLAAAIVLFVAFHYMRAQGEKSPNLSGLTPVPQSETADPKVAHDTLVATYITQGYSGATNTGYSPLTLLTAVDCVTTIKCPWPGCTLEVEASIQVGGVTYTSNEWGTLPQIDGAFAPWPGPWLGETLTDGGWSLATLNWSGPLTPGTHTVQSFAGSYYGMGIYSYHINYRVYVP